MLALHLPAVSSTARELELGSLGTRRRVVGREVITIVGCFSRETGEAEAEVVEVEVEEEESLVGTAESPASVLSRHPVSHYP